MLRIKRNGLATLIVLVFMASLFPLLAVVTLSLTDNLQSRASEVAYWTTKNEAQLGIENAKNLLLKKVNLEEVGGAMRVPALAPLSALKTISHEMRSNDICTSIDVFRLDYPAGLSSAVNARLPRLESVVDESVSESGLVVRTEPKRYYLLRSKSAHSTTEDPPSVFEECVELSFDRAEGKTYMRTVYFRRVSP